MLPAKCWSTGAHASHATQDLGILDQKLRSSYLRALRARSPPPSRGLDRLENKAPLLEFLKVQGISGLGFGN